MTKTQPIRPGEEEKGNSFNARFSRGLSWLLAKLKVEDVPHIKRIIVTVVGGTIVIFGVLMIVTPGPAIIVIPAGLAVLGTEYAWARRWLRKGKMMARKALSQSQKILAPKEKESYRALEASFRQRLVWRVLHGGRTKDAYETQESTLQVEPPETDAAR